MPIPATDSQRTGSYVTVLGLGLLLAGFAIMDSWLSAQRFPGMDFYLHWCVAVEIGNDEVGSVYSPEGRQRIAGLSSQRAALPGAGQDLQTLARTFDKPTIWATPFLYTCFAGFVVGDYSADHRAYRILCVVCIAFALLSFAWIFGLSLGVGLLAFAAMTSASFEPYMSLIRTSNVGQIQLAFLAAFLWTQAGQRSVLRSVLGGVVLGVAVMFKPNMLVPAVLVGVVRLLDRDGRGALALAGGLLGGALVAVLISTQVVAQPDAWSAWFVHIRAFLDPPPSLEQGNYTLARILAPESGSAVSTILMLLFVAMSIGVLWRAGKHVLDLPEAGKHVLDLPEAGKHVLDLPEAGKHVLDLPEAGKHVLDLPEAGRGPTVPRGRGRDAMALAFGCQASLLGAPVAWLHYYVLALPLALFCLRPGCGAAATARILLSCGLIGALALHPAIQLFGLSTTESYAAWCVGSTLALFIVAAITVCMARPAGDASVGDPA